MRVFLAVTADEYELPVAVCDTQYGLDRALGYQKGYVHRSVKVNRKYADGTVKPEWNKGKDCCRVYAVEIDDD